MNTTIPKIYRINQVVFLIVIILIVVSTIYFISSNLLFPSGSYIVGGNSSNIFTLIGSVFLGNTTITLPIFLILLFAWRLECVKIKKAYISSFLKKSSLFSVVCFIILISSYVIAGLSSHSWFPPVWYIITTLITLILLIIVGPILNLIGINKFKKSLSASQ